MGKTDIIPDIHGQAEKLRAALVIPPEFSGVQK
jgi:hypothetical protein